MPYVGWTFRIPLPRPPLDLRMLSMSHERIRSLTQKTPKKLGALCHIIEYSLNRKLFIISICNLLKERANPC